MNVMNWYEQLPALCPPLDAVSPVVTLQPKDGVMKKTFSDSHYSWWRSADFEVSQAKIVDL